MVREGGKSNETERVLKRGRVGGSAAQTEEEKDAERWIERSRWEYKKKERKRLLTKTDNHSLTC